MKKQRKSNLLKSLQSLGIVFAIFFAMAFACGDDGDGTQTDGNLSMIAGTTWKIATEPGRNVQTLLFCKSGRWEVISSQFLGHNDIPGHKTGGAVTFSGTYTVQGDTLIWKMDNATDTYKMKWDGSVLELNYTDGQTAMRLYDKGETECK